MTGTAGSRAPLGRLRRELGTLESYAALIGILVGAGIFKVTSDASASTGPSVILGYFVLAPAVLASSVPYMVFLSTPLGRQPGGEYTHISRTLGPGVAFVGAWLKLISYVGAGAFLAGALADYTIELAAQLGWRIDAGMNRPIAFAGLALFFVVHSYGVRWFARVQVWMCALLGVSIVVLVVPGLLAIQPENYRPFFTGGTTGFKESLVPLFFAYAGFESLAQAAGEVKDSTRKLPRVFLRGIVATTLIFLAMSIVAFGVLPLAELEASSAPMADAAKAYLPVGASAVVALGGVFAVATSLNATIFVPGRLAVVVANDGGLPAWVGAVHSGRGTPVIALAISCGLMAVLLASGQVGLALTGAIVALVTLYALHGVALLLLPRRNPELDAQVTAAIPRWVRTMSGVLCVLSMGTLVVVQLLDDVDRLTTTRLTERLDGSLTALELLSAWAVLGIVVYAARRPRVSR